MRIVKLLAKKIALSGFLGAILFASCTDKTSDIGSDLVPNGPLSDLNMVDTISMNAYTVKVDSVQSTGLQENLLGFLNDPVFGQVSSSIYGQFVPSSSGFKGFDGYVLDSVVLSLLYSKSYYGDTLIAQNINIHEITESIDRAQNYYSNQQFEVNPVAMATKTYTPIPLESDTSVSTRPALKVDISLPISDPFIQRLWNVDSAAIHKDTVANVDYDKFVDLFKGLHIKVDEINGETGALIGFSMSGQNTRIRFYTHKDDETAATNQFDFGLINGLGVWVNNFDHNNFEGADDEFTEQVVNGNKANAKEKLYIQPLSGTRVFMDFPHLKNLNDLGNVVVNKAELVLNYDEEDILEDLNINNPAALAIGLRHTNDTTTVTPGYVLDGADFVGGKIDTANKVYKFRVTRYVQQVLQNKDENELGLVIFSGSESAGYQRLIFRGFDPVDPEQQSKRFRLEVTYSIIE